MSERIEKEWAKAPAFVPSSLRTAWAPGGEGTCSGINSDNPSPCPSTSTLASGATPFIPSATAAAHPQQCGGFARGSHEYASNARRGSTNQKRNSSRGGGGGGKGRLENRNAAGLSKHRLEWNVDTVSPFDVNPDVEQQVKRCLRSLGKRGQAPLPEEEVGSIKGTTIKTVSITFTTADGTSVTATGLSSRKKTAVSLCYMHALRLLDYYAIDLPQWEKEQAKAREATDDGLTGGTGCSPPPPPKPLQEVVVAGLGGDGKRATQQQTLQHATRVLPRSSSSFSAMADTPLVGGSAAVGAGPIGPPIGGVTNVSVQPPRPTDYHNWQSYTKATEAYILTKHDESKEAAFLRLRLPKTRNDLVDRAAAIVERGTATSGNLLDTKRKTLTSDEIQAQNVLSSIMSDAQKSMKVVRLQPHINVSTLVLDEKIDLVATGVGRNAKIAKARCAMHALCILDLMKTDREAPSRQPQYLQDPEAATNTLARILGTRSSGGGSRGGHHHYPQQQQRGEDNGPGQQEHQQRLEDPTLGSAPLSAILMSLTPRYTKLYSFFRCLYEDEKPDTVFSKNNCSGLYVCHLTLNDVSCNGAGINRFEAERDAVETALSQMELYDERLQAINAFMAQFPDISPENIPIAALPAALRDTLKARTDTIRQQQAAERDSGVSGDASLPHGVVGGSQSLGVEEMALFNHLHERRTRRLDDAASARYAAHMQERLASTRAAAAYLDNFHPRRSTLAMATVQTEVVRTVANNRVTIICGTTGCGKTTQVPQYILDDEIEHGRGDACNILVTQPRRLTAYSVADRIAQERLSRVGEDVGYIVRLDAKPGRAITLCTAGVLVQMLSSNPTLEGVTHLLIDEVHERDINCDVILSLGKRLLETNPTIKLVLMSATMQAGLFEAYFGGAPIISVEGAVYPVGVRYLDDIAAAAAEDQAAFYSPMFDLVDKHNGIAARQRTTAGGLRAGGGSASLLAPPKTDYQLIAYLVHRSIHADMGNDIHGKSILVFLPGWKEILEAKQAIERYANRTRSSGGGPRPRFHFILLHSTVEAAKQRECFRPAPEGTVKVVLATNIAESGITIDDAAVVIDAGLIKLTTWASRAGGGSSGAITGWQPLPDPAGNGKSDDSASADAARALLEQQQQQQQRQQAASFTTQLSLGYASRANATQRKGRAGRTQGGVCYRLFTKPTWEALPAHQEAEIHRVPLTQVLLRLLSLSHAEPKRTLQTFIEPPSTRNVEVSMMQLKSLDAVTADEKLTPLGQYLSKLPCDPRVGKMIMLGAVLHCLDSVLTVAATADACPFVTSRDLASEVRQKRFLFSRNSQSDHISFLNAYNAYCRNSEEYAFARHNHLNVNNIGVISKYKRQYRDILHNSGLISRKELRSVADSNSSNGASSPLSASLTSFAEAAGSSLRWDDAALPHPSSPLSASREAVATLYDGALCIDTSKLSDDARDVSLVKACICAALFPNVAVLEAALLADAGSALSALSPAAAAGEAHERRRLASKLSKKIALRTKMLSSISPAAESACRRVGGPREHGVPNKSKYMEDLAQQLTVQHIDPNKVAVAGTPSTLFPAMYYVYQDVFTVREANRSFLTSVTSVSLWALLLFGASSANLQYFDAIGICVLDGWLPVRIDPATFHALHHLKESLHECVWRKYVEPANAANNATLDTLRVLCREVLKAPLDMQDLTLNRLVDCGDIVSPLQTTPQQQQQQQQSQEMLIDNSSSSSSSNGILGRPRSQLGPTAAAAPPLFDSFASLSFSVGSNVVRLPVADDSDESLLSDSSNDAVHAACAFFDEEGGGSDDCDEDDESTLF